MSVTHASPSVPRISQTSAVPVRAWLYPMSDPDAHTHLTHRRWSTRNGVWVMTVCGRLFPQSLLTLPPPDGMSLRCPVCTPTPAAVAS